MDVVGLIVYNGWKRGCWLIKETLHRTVISKQIAVLFLLALLNCVFLAGWEFCIIEDSEINNSGFVE